MFEKNMNDLVRGLRNNKANESKYVTECLDEIKQELRQENMAVKANAILKLSYIQMLGYDISWAAFNVIEVMSSVKFTHKRIAYMAASQSFHADLDVLMLATNLIKKDMNSQNQYDAGVAMVGLSCFISPDLARDLANDIMNMMVSSRPYVRKRAILLMYKVFLNFPEALRPAFPRLKEKLEDVDPGVQCAAVNVICELARKNPRNYLALAPLFFKLMTTSSNNWMLIKIIKLFGALCPLEPRLGKKLLEPLTSLIHRCCSDLKKCRQEREFAMVAKKLLTSRRPHVNGELVDEKNYRPMNATSPNPNKYMTSGISTSAMSLLYECVNTVVAGLPDHQPSMQLCVSKLRLLIEDSDQNLKYLGLLLLNKILASQPKLVLSHRDLILQCLDDRDESIRYRALDLIVGMISRKTLVDIIKKLMSHMENAEGTAYRDELLAKIIQICSQSNYQYVTNFEWYIDILLQLSSVEGTQHGKLIANQMLDITIRVKAIRPQAVPTFASLLSRSSLITTSGDKSTACEVLFAAAWVAGEFAEFLSDIQDVLKSLLNPKVESLPGHIQCVYVQAVAKLFSKILTQCEKEEDDDELEKASEFLINGMSIFTQSSDLEVQDRACCVLQLVKLVMKMQKEGVRCAADVNALFAEELLPVAPKAQKKVPVPEGLDLDKWINEPLSDTDDSADDTDDVKPFFSSSDSKAFGMGGDGQRDRYQEPDEDELLKAREIRMMFQDSNPHYLKGEVKVKKDEPENDAVDGIPIKELDSPVSLKIINGVSDRKGKKKKGKKGKKGRHASESEEEPSYTQYEIAPVVDLGDGEHDILEENPGDPHSLLNVDLDTPLGDHETLPVQTHRVVEMKAQKQPEHKKSKKKKGKGEKEKVEKEKGEKEKGEKEKGEKSNKESKKKTPDDTVAGKSKKEKGHKRSKKNAARKAKEEEEKKGTLLAQASEYAKEKEALAKGSFKTDGVGDTMDNSMDFWLASPDSKPVNVVDNTTGDKTETQPATNKSTTSPDVSVADTKKKSKKKNKEKSTKEKKKKRKSTSKDEEMTTTSPEAPVEETSLFMDLDDSSAHDPYSHYTTLCEDKNLKLLYEIRPNPMQSKQVVCSIIFRNLTSHHIQKLEFNVIDSLSMKLERQAGASKHDPVIVPFVLLPDMTNEGQFAFNVESCVMSQHLRGTLTYILKQASSSTSEKIDFKLEFRVGVYIVQKPISSEDFTSLLAGGELKEKQSLKITLKEDIDLEVLLQNICMKLQMLVVEHMSGGASLYGSTIQEHPICLLVKKVNPATFSVDGKSTDFQLLSSIFKEIKDLSEEI